MTQRRKSKSSPETSNDPNNYTNVHTIGNSRSKKQLKRRRSHVTLRKRSNPKLLTTTPKASTTTVSPPTDDQTTTLSSEASTSRHNRHLSNPSTFTEKVLPSSSLTPTHPSAVVLASSSPELNDVGKVVSLISVPSLVPKTDNYDCHENSDESVTPDSTASHQEHPTLSTLQPPSLKQRTPLKSIMKPPSQQSIELAIQDPNATNGTIEVSSKKSVSFQEQSPIRRENPSKSSTTSKTITSTILRKTFAKGTASAKKGFGKNQLESERLLREQSLLASRLDSHAINDNLTIESDKSLEKLYFEPDHYSPEMNEDSFVDDLVDKYDHLSKKELKKLKKKASKTAISVNPPHLGNTLAHNDSENNSHSNDKFTLDSTNLKPNPCNTAGIDSFAFTTSSILRCDASQFDDLNEFERVDLQLKLLKQRRKELKRESRLQFWSSFFKVRQRSTEQQQKSRHQQDLQPLQSSSTATDTTEEGNLGLDYDGLYASTPVSSSAGTSTATIEGQERRGQLISETESRLAEEELKRILTAGQGNVDQDKIKSMKKLEKSLQRKNSFLNRGRVTSTTYRSRFKSTNHYIENELHSEENQIADAGVESDEDNDDDEQGSQCEKPRGRTRTVATLRAAADNLKSLFYKTGGKSVTDTQLDEDEEDGVEITEDGMMLVYKDLLPDPDTVISKPKKKLRSPTRHIVHPDTSDPPKYGSSRLRGFTRGTGYSVRDEGDRAILSN